MPSVSNTALDTATIRRDFPLLQRKVDGQPVVYLDSAATSLKPSCVIERITEYYTHYSANVHRGVHPLGDEATQAYEEARDTIAAFINADARDIAFVRNATEAINVVASGCASDGNVLYCQGDHHSNLLPWQRMSGSQAVAVQPDGTVDVDDLRRKLDRHRPSLLAATHVSNAFGGINPIEQMIAMAHEAGCAVLVDASQSVPHQTLDVRQLDCDYLCFSGHKMCGPTGIGVLYAKRQRWENARPWYYGGSMVREVHADSFALGEMPARFEAGTPAIEAAIGLAAACEYLRDIGLQRIQQHDNRLLGRALERLGNMRDVKLHGPREAARCGASITFTVPGMESHAVARLLANRFNIYVRSGFHCAQPAHEALDVPPTVRASVYLYNDLNEVDYLCDALARICHYLS